MAFRLITSFQTKQATFQEEPILERQKAQSLRNVAAASKGKSISIWSTEYFGHTNLVINSEMDLEQMQFAAVEVSQRLTLYMYSGDSGAPLESCLH